MLIQKENYQFEFNNSENFIIKTRDGKLNYLENSGIPFLPVCNKYTNWDKPEIKMLTSDENEKLIFNIPDNTLYENPQVVLELKDNFVEFYFKGKVKTRTALHKWYLLGKGTVLKAIECLDFRSHIDSPAAYKTHQTILGRRKLGTIGLDANTNDSDLMFAPHPMMFLFTHLDEHLTIAPMNLIQGESLNISMLKGTNIINDFYIEIGNSIYWLEENEILESPHFMITLNKSNDIYDSLSKYTDILEKEKKISKKNYKNEPDWWKSPIWCSWGDQHTLLDSGSSDDIVNVKDAQKLREQAVHNITEQMILKIVDVIEKNNLPIRTLIMDDRWYTWQGDMVADKSKFPDLRKLSDKLHDKGFKLLCWASLYQFELESEVVKKHPDWFIIHHYHRNVNPEKNIIHLDYSKKEVQEQYLPELMERLLSNKPGCYNLDGIKFDWPFLIPHNYAYTDRKWVGKETTIYNTQKLVYESAKKVKKDALIIGVSPHPFFQDTQDVIRTYDVSTFDPRIHYDRAKYIKAVSPGMQPCMDEHVFYQNFFKYIEEGSKLGTPMIYNILRFNGDGHVYTQQDYSMLKQLLLNYVDNNPDLKKYFKQINAI